MLITQRISKSTTVQISGDSQAEVFRELAAASEVFGHSTCKACDGDEVQYRVRTVDGNNYHEIACLNTDCRAILAFGQHRKGNGTLFPKRKDANGAWLKNEGWVRWTPDGNEKA